jgi:hypothetical protein
LLSRALTSRGVVVGSRRSAARGGGGGGAELIEGVATKRRTGGGGSGPLRRGTGGIGGGLDVRPSSARPSIGAPLFGDTVPDEPFDPEVDDMLRRPVEAYPFGLGSAR